MEGDFIIKCLDPANIISSVSYATSLWNGIGEDQKHTVPKCLLITQRKNGLKYYYKNREKKLAYSKTYSR